MTNPNSFPSTTTTLITDAPPPNTPNQPNNNNSSSSSSSGGGGGSIIDSFPTLFPLVIAGACVLGLILAFLIIWFTRRAAPASAPNHPAKAVVPTTRCCSVPRSSSARSSGEGDDKGGGGGLGGSARRKLQKACSVGAEPVWWAREGGSGLLSDDEDGEGRGWPRRHVSLPLIPRACSKGHFHFGVGGGIGGSSCRWPGRGGVDMGEVKGVGKRKPAWIDEDALHGPKVSGGGKKKNKGRGSWPLRNRTPTLPRVHHTVHGYPYMMSGARGESSEALLGESRPKTATGLEYAQLRASSRDLPQPPKPALVSNRERRTIRPSVTMGYVYGASKIPTPFLSPPASPVQSAPTTPQRHRGRQRSTDSTLTDILRSTEERLREGSVSGTTRIRRATASPTRASPGKVFGPREYGVPVSRARTPSPSKIVTGEPFTPGHRRQTSRQSVSSDSDSLVGEQRPVSDVPSGLTSPSRAQKKQEPERQLLPAQSTRTSLSSELSTLYSEDEMPDEVKRAIMPLEGLVVQPQQATKVRPPSINDPFVSAPLALSVSRAASVGGWPTKHSKSQDLLRQSVQRSQRLRSMTVGHTRAQSQGLILAPGPAIHRPKAGVLPSISPSRKESVIIPPSMQPYIVSRASEPPPSPTRQSLTGNSPNKPLFLRVTKTSTLSTIPLLPPPSAPSIDIFSKAESKQHSPSKTATITGQQQQQPERRSKILLLSSTERSSAPASPTRRVGGELRLSLILPPKPLQGLQHQRASASSSVYSQEASPTTTTATAQTAIELNRANFRANSSLYPAPLSPHPQQKQNNPNPSSELPLDNNNNNTTTTITTTTTPPPPTTTNPPDNDDEDTPLALTATITSLRRMNSGLSTVSSLLSIADRDLSPSPSPSPSPDRVSGMAVSGVVGEDGGGAAGDGGSPERFGGFGGFGGGGGGESPRSRRKSIGTRNYYILGGGNGVSSRRGSRVVSCGGGGGRRSSAVLRLSQSEFAAVGEEGKENSTGMGGFKVAAGEFTFEVSNPNVSGKGGLGLREGSSGSVNALVMPQQKDSQRLSLAWRPAEGGASRNGSPARFNGSPSRQSMRSVEMFGLV
ncbi:predicted protein [Chaetomium globosum CBS 148.51]|uniref:Uncharacterized protein n=1 Tax=Chaetomium globosum (strain ATCC 6205 / CBS 148.51 / DSM 1962 / NBRC 6347 / NRRL 1970) TaxID=306901 RepID=Q2HBB7_CHAGB|nr:uncharacterized protein CHGG_02487 [Chaetomium globosum CBS 148.51]EAQ90552.1 predicted protein [Chaetomium globosum CBS 148.51]